MIDVTVLVYQVDDLQIIDGILNYLFSFTRTSIKVRAYFLVPRMNRYLSFIAYREAKGFTSYVLLFLSFGSLGGRLRDLLTCEPRVFRPTMPGPLETRNPFPRAISSIPLTVVQQSLF